MPSGSFMQFRHAVLSIFLVSCALAVSAQISEDQHAGAQAQAAINRYHDGGIRDLGAIGTRKIGCNRGFGNWYTLERQIAMGKDYSKQIESTSRLITDPSI